MFAPILIFCCTKCSRWFDEFTSQPLSSRIWNHVSSVVLQQPEPLGILSILTFCELESICKKFRFIENDVPKKGKLWIISAKYQTMLTIFSIANFFNGIFFFFPPYKINKNMNLKINWSGGSTQPLWRDGKCGETLQSLPNSQAMPKCLDQKSEMEVMPNMLEKIKYKTI